MMLLNAVSLKRKIIKVHDIVRFEKLIYFSLCVLFVNLYYVNYENNFKEFWK